MMSVATLQDSFVKLLPWMQKTARLAFQNLDHEKREENIAATVALAWKHFHRLNERGRAAEPGILKSVVFYTLKHIRAARKIDSARKPKCPLALRPYGKVTFDSGNIEDLVGKRAGVFDIVSFRIDIPKFLATLTQRQRTMVYDLAMGHGTGEVAKKHGVTPGAVSQFRNRFRELHSRFFGE